MSIRYDKVLNTTVSIVSRLANSDTELSADTEMQADIGMTSLQVMELVLEIEEEFDISFPLNRLPDILTIKDRAQEILASLDQ